MAAALAREQSQLRNRLERIYSLTSDLICTAGFDGYFKDINPAFEKLIGFTRDELLSTPFIEFVHEEDREATLAAVSRLEEGQKATGFENHYRSQDGTWKWLSWNANSDLGEGLIYAVAHDLTERKKAEEALKEQHSTLIGIIENTQALIFSVDRNYRYTSFNHGHAAVMQDIYGVEIKIGQSLLDCMTVAVDREKAERNLDRALAGEQFVESAYSREDTRSQLYFEVSHNPIRTEDGTVIGVSVFSNDVTDRKRTEEELELRVQARTAQLEKSNKDLEAFSYSVSHDLRAPLRAINGFAQILARRHRADLDEEGQHYLDNVVEASTRMGVLIDDLLQYSRIGRASVHRHTVRLEELFAQILGDLSPRITETHGEIHLPPPGSMPSIQSDATILSQIFTNIIENALTFHKPGTPPVIQVTCQAEVDHTLFGIADNGIGIPAEYLEKIFIELTLDAFKEAHIANTIHVAQNGQEGLDYLLGHGQYVDRQQYPLPLLILLDLKMPGLDGFEVLRQVKATPIIKCIPVVIMSSSREEGDRALSYDIGANSYLVKPVSFEGFAEVVRHINSYWLLMNVEPPEIE